MSEEKWYRQTKVILTLLAMVGAALTAAVKAAIDYVHNGAKGGTRPKK